MGIIYIYLFYNSEKAEVSVSNISTLICSKTKLLNNFLDYRKYLNDQIFSIFIHKRIIDRFKRKADIIQWQLTHDKLPPLSCIEFLQCKLFCLNNPLQYDYPLQDDRTLYEVFLELSKNNIYQMKLISPLTNVSSNSSNSNNTTTGNNNYKGYTKYLMKYTNPNYQAQPLSSTANSSSYDSKMNLRISGNVNPMITKLKKVGSVHSLERVSGRLPSMFSSESNSEHRSNNYKHSSLSKVYLYN